LTTEFLELELGWAGAGDPVPLSGEAGGVVVVDLLDLAGDVPVELC
jgi:hypothetical protein